MSTMILEIVTPERKVYEKEVDMVVVKGIEGELGILPNHIPFVTPLAIAPLRAKIGNSEERIAVHGGFMEVHNNRVVILAEAAERSEDIDVDRARRAKERAEQRLRATKQENIDFHRAEIALKKAIVRLDTAKK